MSAGTIYTAPGSASFAPTYDPILRPRTPSSYSIIAGTAEDVASYLARQGWRRATGNTPLEVARLHRGRGLVVLYSSSVLVQGAAQVGHGALTSLVED